MRDVNETEMRGERIRTRIYQGETKPVIPVTEVVAEAGVSRQAVYDAMEGKASGAMYKKIEDALDRLEADRAEHPEDYEPLGLHTVTLKGVFGVAEVTLSAPTGDAVVADAERLLRMLETRGDIPPSS